MVVNPNSIEPKRAAVAAAGRMEDDAWRGIVHICSGTAVEGTAAEGTAAVARRLIVPRQREPAAAEPVTTDVPWQSYGGLEGFSKIISKSGRTAYPYLTPLN